MEMIHMKGDLFINYLRLLQIFMKHKTNKSSRINIGIKALIRGSTKSNRTRIKNIYKFSIKPSISEENMC